MIRKKSRSQSPLKQAVTSEYRNQFNLQVAATIAIKAWKLEMMYVDIIEWFNVELLKQRRTTAFTKINKRPNALIATKKTPMWKLGVPRLHQGSTGRRWSSIWKNCGKNCTQEGSARKRFKLTFGPLAADQFETPHHDKSTNKYSVWPYKKNWKTIIVSVN
jgi:hypothetical protein